MIQRKVCLVGDFAVGKTSLFSRFVYNRFSESYMTTIGVRLQRKVMLVEGQELTLILWDTEGGQDSTAVKRTYLGGAGGAIVVCDLTRESSIHHWPDYIQLLRQINPTILLTLAANKVDLLAPNHPHRTLVQQIAQEAKLPLVFTSANTGEQVETLFQTLAKELLRAEVFS